MKKVLVVGSANMDLVMRADRLPRSGETLMGRAFMTAHGGKGANQAVAAVRLGGQVTFIACLGNDSFGALQREALARENISLDGLNTHPDLPTGTAMILIADTGENTIIVAPGANSRLLAEDIADKARLFEDADVVIGQFEVPLPTVTSAMRMARTSRTFSVLDAGAAGPEASAVLPEADLVSPNESEAETLTGIRVDSLDAAHSAARRLHDMGATHVVLKLGAQGCLYLGEEEAYVPAFEVNAIDPTGAGDAFTAALALGWGKMPLEDILLFANAAGALATTVTGAQPSMPTFEAVMRFLQEQGHSLELR